MSKDTSPIRVTILDKEYLIGCEEEEKESLRQSVDYLNQQMAEMKSGGGVIGAERIAVMTALNKDPETASDLFLRCDNRRSVLRWLKKLEKGETP